MQGGVAADYEDEEEGVTTKKKVTFGSVGDEPIAEEATEPDWADRLYDWGMGAQEWVLSLPDRAKAVTKLARARDQDA